MIEQLLSHPGFIYEINGKYYFLGKWICKECTEVDACDCVMMYNMCRSSNEKNETAIYFQKMRAYSDFALEIPYNPTQIRSDMEALLDSLSESALSRLQAQYDAFGSGALCIKPNLISNVAQALSHQSMVWQGL